MTALPEWLSAQLDEDEEIAKAATQGDWVWSREFVTPPGYHHRTVGPLEPGDAAHISRQSPARALQEIGIDRELLAEYVRLARAYEAHRKETDRIAASGDDDPIRSAALRREADYLPAMLHVMERWAKRKAAVYADRPGFKREWLP